MFITEFNSILISQYIYENRDKIPIIDTIKITDFTYGRLDIILNRYYRNKPEYIPLLYDFNRITDPTSLNIGRLIDIPDFDALIESMLGNYIFVDEGEEENIPGVNNSMNSTTVNQSLSKTNNKAFTTALPKLNITLRKVSYDSNTGIVRY